MSIKISRRRWLLTATIATLALPPATADPPQAQPAVGSSSLPVPTRSIRLQGLDDTRVVVTAIAADPRGEYLAAAGDDFAIRILRTSNLSTAAVLREHRDVVRTLAFDPQGQRLVSAGNDGQLILWDRDDSFRMRQRMQKTPTLACVRFSPDGSQMAAVGFDSEVFLIGRGRQQRPSIQCDCTDLRAVAYRDDNEVLAVAGRSGNLHLLDPEIGRLLGEYELHRARIHGLVFHRHSNQVICVAEDGSVTLFDTETRSLVQRIPVTTGKLFAVTVLNSQTVAVAGSNNVIHIVDTDEGRVVRQLQGHTGSVPALAASGGFLFSGSFDATLRRWSLDDTGPQRQRLAEGDPRIDR